MELKVYISGKITGENHDSCKLKFLAMQVRLLAMGVHTVINPNNLGITDTWTWEAAMEKCIQVLLKDANIVVMLNDWETSKGACMEYQVAKEKNYLIVFEYEVEDLFSLARAKYKSINAPVVEVEKQRWIDTSDIEFP